MILGHIALCIIQVKGLLIIPLTFIGEVTVNATDEAIINSQCN
jgi:hypothetical protein